MNRYMEQNQGSKVPWEDLIFIFGEIVYGGHIVNDIDRILANAYLKNCMVDELFDDLELFPYLDPKMSHLSFKVTA